MTVYRCILPTWATERYPDRKRVVEGELSKSELRLLNAESYNIYYLPNFPSIYHPGTNVDGSQIDTFKYVFVDMDLKEGIYTDKYQFLEVISSFPLTPTKIVDSGNGLHVYWEVSDLQALDFLKLQRRLTRHFKTDEAVSKIYQLMRVPNTYNTKDGTNLKLCEQIYTSDNIYSCEELDKHLPVLTPEDEEYCRTHYSKTYNKEKLDVKVDEKLPIKFAQLIEESKEVKDIWAGSYDDRSKADYRLGHIMFAYGFSKDEARSVLVNSAKALERAPIHRINYANNIIDKIWTFETTNRSELSLSLSVLDILEKRGDTIKGTRFQGPSYLDGTDYGFRLGQVIGLVAGSGVGKTTMALNMFLSFVKNNPDYEHFFVPLEQPANEIAMRWKNMCGDDIQLYGNKVQIISNYDQDGNYRHLSLEEIKEYLIKYQQITGKKIGCVVIDHIGALKKKGKNGENQDLIDICHAMKAFAVQTNTLVIMQSQSNREKAGIGDLELNKDAAYGTIYFEAYCDFLLTLWQPLKRCYKDLACPTVMAYKFCKIRHKTRGKDKLDEDIPYRVIFDSVTERLRPLTQNEEIAFDFFNNQALNKRKANRHTDVVAYHSVTWKD